jgi:hypothetical protein
LEVGTGTSEVGSHEAATSRVEAVLTAARVWAGGELMSADTGALVSLVADLEHGEPVPIGGVPTNPADLLAAAVDDARASGKQFRSGPSAAKYLRAVVADCVRRGRMPGDFGQPAKGGQGGRFSDADLERLIPGDAA